MEDDSQFGEGDDWIFASVSTQMLVDQNQTRDEDEQIFAQIPLTQLEKAYSEPVEEKNIIVYSKEAGAMEKKAKQNKAEETTTGKSPATTSTSAFFQKIGGTFANIRPRSPPPAKKTKFSMDTYVKRQSTRFEKAKTAPTPEKHDLILVKEGISDSYRKKFNESPKSSQLRIKFAETLSSSVNYYVCDFQSGNTMELFPTATFYKAIAMNIPVISPLWTRSINEGSLPNEPLEYEMQLEEGAKLSRKNKTQLFADTQFYLVDEFKFKHFNFDQQEFEEILVAGGGKVHYMTMDNVRTLIKTSKSSMRTEKYNSGKFAFACYRHGLKRMFDEMFQHLGIITIHPRFVLNSLRRFQFSFPEKEDLFTTYEIITPKLNL